MLGHLWLELVASSWRHITEIVSGRLTTALQRMPAPIVRDMIGVGNAKLASCDS